jgi:CdiI N-terminal domain
VFSIHFSDEDRFEPGLDARGAGTPHRFVETILGDYEDRIAAPLNFWGEADYEAQWKEGAERLLWGAESSCLVKRMEDPASDDQIVDFWELYRIDADSVVVQNRAPWAPASGGPLDPSLIYEAVLPLATDHEGLPPLERRIWTADLADWIRKARA